MSEKKRIGIIGFGSICNGAHLVGYEECRDIAEITAVCDNDPAKLALAKEKLGLDDTQLFLDYNDLIASGLVDAVDISTPNDIHCKAAMAAVKAGLDFSVEKPVGLNFAEVKELYEAAEAKGVKTFVCLSYRYMAPMRYMKKLVDEGKFGKARHINITYYKDSGLWEGRRLEWRFDKSRAGTGVLGDLGVHLLDTVRFLGEEFDGLFAQTGITVKERETLEGGEIRPVTTDDWCFINGMTRSGATVQMGISRVATTIRNFVEFEVIGEKGRIKYGVGIDGEGRIDKTPKLVACFNGEEPRKLDVPAEYETVQSRAFVNSLLGITDGYASDLKEGLECQKLLEACELSDKAKRYIRIDEI